MDQTSKRPTCKKGKVRSTDFGPEDKLNFYGPTEKSRFEFYKSKSMAYGRTVEPTTEPPETQSSATNNLQQIQRGLDGVKTMLIAMKEQMDKISDVTKKNRYRCSQTQDGHGSHKKIRNQDIQFHDREDEEGHQRS
nr:uncharacterized protein LOC117273458 isoform X2 [Nicotiana tomentosiformis]